MGPDGRNPIALMSWNFRRARFGKLGTLRKAKNITPKKKLGKSKKKAFYLWCLLSGDDL